MQAYNLSLHTSSACGLGKKVKKSECGHVTYQINGKEENTNIEVKTLILQTPLTSGSD